MSTALWQRCFDVVGELSLFKKRKDDVVLLLYSFGSIFSIKMNAQSQYAYIFFSFIVIIKREGGR